MTRFNSLSIGAHYKSKLRVSRAHDVSSSGKSENAFFPSTGTGRVGARLRGRNTRQVVLSLDTNADGSCNGRNSVSCNYR